MRTFRQWLTDYTSTPQPVDTVTYNPTNLLDAIPAHGSVSGYGAMLSADFLACETVKARAIRSLPVHVMRREPNGRIPAEDHPLQKVFHQPNAMQTWGDLISWAVIYRDVFGTAYMRVYRDMLGRVTELRPVVSHVSMGYDRDTGRAVYTCAGDKWNPPFTCNEDGLVILKTDISQDGGVTGESLAEKAASVLGLSVDLTEFYRAVIENGNHFGGYLETDGKLTVEDRKAIRESLDETRGAENAGRIRIFDRGLKYHDVQAQMAGLDIIAQERFVLEQVCRVCHVDKHHVFADDKTTATSASGADIDFAKATVLPDVIAIEQAFQPLLDRAAVIGGRDSGYRVKLDMNGLLRGDFTTRMEGYRIGVYAGIFTREYCATCEDIPSLPGQEKLLQPTAYYYVDEDGNAQLPAPATEGTAGQSDGVSGIDPKEVGDRLQPVIHDAQVRISKRAAKDGDTETTRNFASMVFAPIEQCAALSGVILDTQTLIDEAIGAEL